jgi:hypothetical protein
LDVDYAERLAAGEHIGPSTSIERDFRKFDQENPQVYAELVRVARLWRERRSAQHLGIATLYEVTRWNLALATEDGTFKLNNNHRALYARKIMAHESDLADMFRTRKDDEIGRGCRCTACA